MDSEHRTSVCTVCGGFIFRYQIVRSMPPTGPWLHLHEDDWKDEPHTAVPQERVRHGP